MGARPDGADDLLRFRGGEDKLRMRRGFLDELQQRVETRGGDHVGLVDDVDLVAAVHRSEEGAFSQVPGVLDTAVAGGVDLDHVDAARPAARQVLAGTADPAGRGRGALFAVQAARQDAGGGGLAAAARPGEQVGVVDAVVVQGPHQGHGDVVLADHLGERIRAVTPVERQRWGRDLGARPPVVRDRMRRRRGRGGRRFFVSRLVEEARPLLFEGGLVEVSLVQGCVLVLGFAVVLVFHALNCIGGHRHFPVDHVSPPGIGEPDRGHRRTVRVGTIRRPNSRPGLREDEAPPWGSPQPITLFSNS